MIRRTARVTTSAPTAALTILSAATLLVGAGVVGLAARAQAVAPPEGCVDGAAPAHIGAWWNGSGVSLRVKGTPCQPVTLAVSTGDVPDDWDGRGFNRSAAPQTFVSGRLVTLDGADVVTVPLSIPDCGPFQWDVTYPPLQRQTITWPTGHGPSLVRAGLRHGAPCTDRPAPAATRPPANPPEPRSAEPLVRPDSAPRGEVRAATGGAASRLPVAARAATDLAAPADPQPARTFPHTP